MEQHGLKGIQYGLWAIAVSLLFLTLSLTLTKKPRYLPDGPRVIDTYTGQQFLLSNNNARVQEPIYRFDELSGKISD